MMSEIIFITYTIASAASREGPILGYHMVLNYIDSSGVHRILEGQPERKFTDTFEKAEAFIREDFFSDAITVTVH